jgi:hypothetical protein
MDSFFSFQKGSQNGILLDIPYLIGWWFHIDTTLNNLFWKKITMGDIRIADLLLRIHLVSWKIFSKNLFTKHNFMWHYCLTCFYIVVSWIIWYLVKENWFCQFDASTRTTSCHIGDSKWTQCKDEFTSTTRSIRSVWSWNWRKGAVWCWPMKDPWNIFWHHTKLISRYALYNI